MVRINSRRPRPFLSGKEPLSSITAGPGRAYPLHWACARNIAAVALFLALPLLALAQNFPLNLPQGTTGDNGKPWGPYTVQQSIEFGGHIAGIDGNQLTYDTFTDIHSGPRLLSQSLSMTQAPGSGGFFDSLFVESFGFGGDPEDLARLRIKKEHWYDFVALYRRDKNYFDYNYFANPFTFNNPSNLVTNSAGQLSPFLISSPHAQITTRNMGDFNLTLFPTSIVTVRLGFSRDNNQGMIDSTLHEANEISITGPESRFRGDRYNVGIDFKPLPRTTFSYDQYYEYDHLNYNWVDNPFSGFFETVGGVSVMVDPGVPLQTNPNMVTSGCIPTAGTLGYLNGGGISPRCNNGTFFYNRSNVVHTGTPTERLSAQSSYFRRLDLFADFLYSSSTSDLLDYNDVWSGIGTHSGVRVYQIGGPAQTRRFTNNGDLGLTYQLTHSWSVSDKFRYLNWSEPGYFNQTEYNCYPNAGSATLLTGIGSPCALTGLISGLPGPGLSGTVPVSIATALAPPPANNPANPYASLNPFIQSLGERSYFNTTTVNWHPARRFSGFVGFRYGRRELSELDGEGVITNVPLTAPTTNATTLANATNAVFVPASLEPAETFTARLNEYTGLGGVTLRPTDAWRINADVEALYSDNAFTQITPRHQQRVRVNTQYKVNRWASVFGSFHLIATQNDFASNVGGANLFPVGDIPAYGHRDHYRYYTLGLSLNPNSRLGLDLGYTYMNQDIHSASCLPVVGTLTPPTGGYSAVTISGAASPITKVCPTVVFTEANTPVASGEPTITGGVPLVLNYLEHTNSGYVNLSLKPVKRFTVMVGYQITSDSGNNIWIRGDNGQELFYAVDRFMNIVAPGSASAVAVAAGPNPLVPVGPQAFTWQQPFAGLEIPLGGGVAFKGFWNYYDYNEKNAFQGPAIVPRDFHANVGTLALKYSF
jgi:hypothetical protein